jgi:hypothetical protein
MKICQNIEQEVALKDLLPNHLIQDLEISDDEILDTTQNTSLESKNLELSSEKESEICNLKSYLISKFLKKEKNIVEYIKTQKGSRTLQSKLINSSSDDINFLLQLLSRSLPDLIKNPYANYFCKELFQLCSVKQKILILSLVRKIF